MKPQTNSFVIFFFKTFSSSLKTDFPLVSLSAIYLIINSIDNGLLNIFFSSSLIKFYINIYHMHRSTCHYKICISDITTNSPLICSVYLCPGFLYDTQPEASINCPGEKRFLSKFIKGNKIINNYNLEFTINAKLHTIYPALIDICVNKYLFKVFRILNNCTYC